LSPPQRGLLSGWPRRQPDGAETNSARQYGTLGSRIACQLGPHTGAHDALELCQPREQVAFDVEITGDIGPSEAELIGRPEQPAQRPTVGQAQPQGGVVRSCPATVPAANVYGDVVAERSGNQRMHDLCSTHHNHLPEILPPVSTARGLCA